MKKIERKNVFTALFMITILGLMAFTGCDVNPPVKPENNNQNNQNNLNNQNNVVTNNQPATTTDVSFSGGNYFKYDFDPKSAIETKKFTTEKELKEFVARYENQGYYGNYYGRGEMMMDVRESSAPMMSKAVSMDSAVAGSSNGGTDFSGTNNQVASVDEADMLKTDGAYIYTITNGVVYIVKAYPEDDSKLVSTISLDKYTPQALFIKGNNLAVFGNFYDNDYFKTIDYTPRNGMSFLNVYDLSDKEKPKLVKEYKFEGNYYNGRMKGDYVYMLTQTGMYDRPIPMPMIFEDGIKRTIPVDDIYYFPINYNYPEFININALNLADINEDIKSKSVAVEGGQNLYMSEDNIYITYTEWLNEYEFRTSIMMDLIEDKLTEDDKMLIAKIEKVDNDILSNREKKSKIESIYMSYTNFMGDDERDTFNDKVEELLKEKLDDVEYFEYTVIHKINVDGNKITPLANGKVPGSIMNQFSLDEDKGNLRIATTLSARWNNYGKENTKSTNNVFATDANLKIIGSLKNLAEDERIYSTRFIGDRLYMVTFRQVDPFFVIDLSNPEKIEELGQLKIPGFSRYLHPYDDNTIIGIGQDATETGRTKGLKISLFDVSDVKNPKEVAKYITEERYASSTALYEHKAFLFSKDKNLLVIPAYSYDYNGNEGYNGAFVFNIDKKNIELRGLIDHSGGLNNNYYGPGVERSLYIEDMLYTKSASLIRINALKDLSSVNNITLSAKPAGIKVY